MRNAYFIVGLLIGVGLTLFALQNTAAVEIRFLFWQTQGPLAAVVLLSAIGGLVIALLFGLPEIISARWRIRSLERRLENEGSALKGSGDVAARRDPPGPPIPPHGAS